MSRQSDLYPVDHAVDPRSGDRRGGDSRDALHQALSATPPGVATHAGVAPTLRAGLDELGRVMPTDLRTLEDILEYRRVGAARTTTAAEIATRLGLSADERTDVPACPVTVFSTGRVPAARVLFLHGGGLIAGCRFDGADVIARHADALDLEVWTLEYPLAPEQNLDAMIDVVLEVVAAAGDELPLVLAGQSGGGGLAAATALAARDRGIRVDAQLLVCPMLDRTERASTRQFADSPAWSAISHRTAWSHVLDGAQTLPPGETADLRGVPPTFLDTGGAELFRDSILDHAARLSAAGTAVELHMYSGAFHSSDCVLEDAEVSRDAHRARESWLRRVLARDV